MNYMINPQHLKFFCDAVFHGSVSEAAKCNFVTQSTVSQAISKLEKVLGVQLAQHSRKKFQATDEGRVVYEQARHVFKSLQDIHEKINYRKETVAGSVKFACTNSLGMSFIAPVYKKMQQTFPGVQLEMNLGNLHFIRQALRQHTFDLAIVVWDETLASFAKCTLKRGLFYVYQHKEAPLHQIENGILIDFHEGMHVAELKKLYPNIKSALAGWEVVARFVEKNIGCGFFPDYLIADGRYPHLIASPVALPPFEYDICAIYNHGQALSRAASAFLELFD
jgi:DNA-binding transcriptional LysR family regulator